MKNSNKLLLEEIYRIIAYLPRTEDNWQVAAERALIRMAGLLIRLAEFYDCLKDWCDHPDEPPATK